MSTVNPCTAEVIVHSPSVRSTAATCPYCGVGCGVLIEHDDHGLRQVIGDPNHPANYGMLCTKGATLLQSVRPEGRLFTPEWRPERTQAPIPLPWSEALDKVARQFGQIIRDHGPDAVGFYLSGQLLTEDYYVFNKLAKGLIGTNNVDTNSRLCMSSAVVAYKQTLGADAPPCSYEDLELSDCLLIAGSNMAYAHPILYRRIEAAREKQPGRRLIVVDPRRTETAAAADLHLAILPGTDIWLYNAMLHVLIWEELLDQDFIRDHTNGFGALRQQVAETTPAIAADICGLSAEQIIQAARWWGKAATPMSLWCQGLNQSHHGTHNGTALIALSLATGKIGKPGCGPFSLTGQPNAMGGREVGGLSNLLSAHRDLANSQHREEVAQLWGIPSVPAQPGFSAVELFEAARAGQVKALWIVCTNPAHSMPDQALIREALTRCELVVVQDAYAHTETTAYADLLLPACTWGEKEGTVTNSERCITHVRPALAMPGHSRADWRIGCDFAHVLGRELGRVEEAERLFPYEHPREIFEEHCRTTAGRDLDITGLSYDILDQRGPQRWPFPQGATQDKARLYTDHCFATADGRANFVVPVTSLTAESCNARYPFHLTSGRLRDQWHTMTRTGRVAQLGNHDREPCLQLNPADMARRGLTPGSLVSVSSPRGKLVIRLQASQEVASGQAFMAMHGGRNRLNSHGVNELTLKDFDPHSKQPELKHAVVRIEPAVLPYTTVMMGSAVDSEQARRCTLQWLDQIPPLLSPFGYASVSLVGRNHPAVILNLAHDEPIPAAWLKPLDQLFGLVSGICMEYHDARAHIVKKALLVDHQLIAARLTGETLAAPWLESALLEKQTVTGVRRWLLAPLSTPPASIRVSSRTICNCFEVSEDALQTAIKEGSTLTDLQAALRCGTQCGSCLPEIRRMLGQHQKESACSG